MKIPLLSRQNASSKVDRDLSGEPTDPAGGLLWLPASCGLVPIFLGHRSFFSGRHDVPAVPPADFRDRIPARVHQNSSLGMVPAPGERNHRAYLLSFIGS